MQRPTNRHARKNETSEPGSRPGLSRRARWAALAAATALLAATAVSAQAATGGISGTEGATAGSSAEVGSPVEGTEVAFSPLRAAGASWYGPGLYGRRTACGQLLRPSTVGVAHRNLPCGTTVKFLYHGHVLVTQVIDRGPYVRGRSWDLTTAAHEALEFEGVGTVHYAVALTPAAQGVGG